SRQLAVLEERQRSLLSTQSSVLADKDRTSDEEQMARERFTEAEQEASRLQAEYEEAQKQYSDAQQALQTRQAERASLEEQLRSVRAEIEKSSAQRAESQARLDELKSRLENLQSRLDNAEKAIQLAEVHARESDEKLTQARTLRESAEEEFRDAKEKEEGGKREVERLENERRAKSEERARQLAQHTRLQAQLEVLEQAEQSLAGYAEGARFLLDAARQERLKGARGALSASLDVPAELEVAIAAALGDTLDAILLDANEIDEALQLLEADGAGRAALLPLGNHSRAPISGAADENTLGVASELVNAPEELRGAVNLMLGQTLIVRDRATARRLLQGLPPHARVVTLRGEVFRGDGLIIAGQSASSSALSRPRQKRELSESLEMLSGQLDSLNRDVDSLSSQISEAQRELAHAEEAVRAVRLKLEEAQGSERQAGLESESARRQLDWQKSQHNQLNAEAEEAASIRQSLIQSLSDIEAQSAKAQEEVRALSETLRGMDLAEAQNQASYWSTRVAVVERALA
ncbi:MAG TPA: hypothetical protein VID27_12085, partial [Blastocatellia bacterium]